MQSAFGVEHGDIEKGFGSSMFGAGRNLAGKSSKAATLGGAMRGGKKFQAGQQSANRLARLQQVSQSMGPRPPSPFDRGR